MQEKKTFSILRPSGRSYLLPLRALRLSAIYARLLKKP